MDQNQHTPEPFGYFKPEPFGWVDCKETDDFAIPLFDKASICLIQTQRDELLAALEGMLPSYRLAMGPAANFDMNLQMAESAIARAKGGGDIASLSELESLRQQLAEKDVEIEALKAASARGKSKDIRSLAEILMSECGCSTEHWNLLNKVETRLWNFFDEQLSASQAREAKLREAFARFIDAHEECTDFDGFTSKIVIMDDYHEADEALSTPPDTDMLEEYVMSRLEVVFYQHESGAISTNDIDMGAGKRTPLYRIKEKI